MTLTLVRHPAVDLFDAEFDDELVQEIRLAQLVITLSGCSSARAFRLVRRRGNESPLDRLARSLTAARGHRAA